MITSEHIIDEGSKTAADCKNKFGWSDREADIFLQGFSQGAHWRISSAYNKPENTPVDNKMTLCLSKNGPFIGGPNYMGFSDTVKHFGIKQWAYVENLMPGPVTSHEEQDVHPKFRKGDIVVFKPLNECMELGTHYDIPFELKGVYKSFQFKVDGFELKHNHIYYTLTSSQFPPISTPECFLDFIGNSLQVPEIKIANPKYNIGQLVMMKTEGELRMLYGQDADLTELIPYVSQKVIIEDVIAVGYSYSYKIRQYKRKSVTVAEDAILCNVKKPSPKEPQECYNVKGGIVAPEAHTAQIDTSKLNYTPMQVWLEIFSNMKSFISSASPELRALAAGQMNGFSEQIMQQMSEE